MGVKKLARKERSNEGGRRPPEKNTQVKINRRHINDSNRPTLSSEFFVLFCKEKRRWPQAA